MIMAEIQQCLAPVLYCWICIRTRQKDDWFTSIKADRFVIIIIIIYSFNVNTSVQHSYNCVSPGHCDVGSQV